MNIEELRTFCLNFKGTSESMPFDNTTVVFKVLSKMFCLESLDNKMINIKALPVDVIELIEHYNAILPAYHMNKKHWISIELENFTDNKVLQNLITNSYHLVVKNMTKKEQSLLEEV